MTGLKNLGLNFDVNGVVKDYLIKISNENTLDKKDSITAALVKKCATIDCVNEKCFLLCVYCCFEDACVCAPSFVYEKIQLS